MKDHAATLTYSEFQRRLDEIDERIEEAVWKERPTQLDSLYEMRQRLVDEWQQKPES